MHEQPRTNDTLNITFRDYVTRDDALVVEDIVLSSGFFNDEEVAIAVELVAERLDKGDRSGYHFLFAEHNNNVLGYSCYGPIPGAERAGRYEIYWIAVYAAFQGLGIGRTILQKTEQAIKTANGKRVYVETSSREQYLPTRRFYRRVGYQVAGTLQDYFDDGDGKVVMVKVLDSEAIPCIEDPSDREVEPG